MRPAPPVFKDVQANGCKTPGCDNFGISPMPWPKGRVGRGGGNPSPDRYRIVNAGLSVLACDKCGKFSTLKSNKGIYEERERLAQDVLDPLPSLACSACGGLKLRKYGKTHSASVRYQCCACKKTYSVGKSTLRQRKAHKNEIVFSLIINKMPLRRMCEVADLSMHSLYDKIDFIYEQCRKFSADRERKTGTGKVVLTSDYYCDEYIDSVMTHPEWFGFDAGEMAHEFPEEYKFELNRNNGVVDVSDPFGEELNFGKVYRFAIARKWARCSYSNRSEELNIDADTSHDAQFVLRQVMNKCLVRTLVSGCY